MPTSIHLPKKLLTAVDRRARSLRISRNRFIVETLEREVGGAGGWSAGFFERFEAPDPELRAAADELATAVREHQRSKGPPRL